MYKKFLVSLLMTLALAGCGQQSSDKQGDQMDTALPVQDQITNPAPVDNNDNSTPTPAPVAPDSVQSAPVAPDNGQPTPAPTATNPDGTPQVPANPAPVAK